MDFLGMGPFEILLVLILGFLLLGPERLPGMAAKAGELYRKFTRATVNLSKSITEEVSAETKTEKTEKTPPASATDEKTSK